MRVPSYSMLIWLSALALLAAAIALFGHFDDDWRSWRPANCMPANCFCEEIRIGAIAQPANTWSSLSFVVMGLIILTTVTGNGPSSGKPAANRLSGNLTAPAVYAFSLLLVGLGSAFYHASLTFVGQFFDLMAMYLLITFVILYNLSRRRRIPFPGFAVWFILINLLLAYVLVVLPEIRRYLFGALVVVALALEFTLRRKKAIDIEIRFLRAALSALAVAFLIWILDITRIACNPTSWLQGHALWHILSASAAGLLYFYYRSEKIPKNPQPEF